MNYLRMYNQTNMDTSANMFKNCKQLSSTLMAQFSSYTFPANSGNELSKLFHTICAKRLSIWIVQMFKNSNKLPNIFTQQGSCCVCAQPMRDDVTFYILKTSHWYNLHFDCFNCNSLVSESDVIANIHTTPCFNIRPFSRFRDSYYNNK